MYSKYVGVDSANKSLSVDAEGILRITHRPSSVTIFKNVIFLS